MSPPAQPKDRLIFGPFTLDPQAAELLRDSRRVRISGQPLQLLIYLTAHPAALITREQLRKHLWSDGTFVDFEHSLNAAMNRLRRALNDSADSARFIETIPGQGYRFIAPVELESRGEAAEIASLTQHPGPALAQALPAVAIKPIPKPRWFARPAFLIPVALLCLVFVIGTTHLHPGHPLRSTRTLVLDDFTNRTGDPVFDGTLRQALSIQLRESPALQIASDDRIHRTLKLMGKPPNSRLTPDLAREVCERIGDDTVLEGSIVNFGSRYALWLRVLACGTGELVQQVQAEAARKEEVLIALRNAAADLQSRSVEAGSTPPRRSRPLGEATTSSLDALKAFSTGLDLAFTKGYTYAIPCLRRATELDPQFAIAYAQLGRMYANIGERSRSLEAVRNAYKFRDRATDPEKFYITYIYDRELTGNLQKSQQTLELWTRMYPQDSLAHGLLGGYTTKALGEYEKSIEESKKAVRLDPDLAPSYEEIGMSNLFLSRPAEAETAIREAAARGLDNDHFARVRYYAAFLKNDLSGMDKELAAAQSQHGGEDWLYQQHALTLARAGRLRDAEAMSLRAIELAQQLGAPERSAIYKTSRAVYLAAFENPAAARALAKSVLAFSKDRDVLFGAAFALSLAGDPSITQAVAAALEHRFPEDTSVRFTYVPILRALDALARRQGLEALRCLEAAAPYEEGRPGTAFTAFFGSLYAAYVRGEAYLTLRRNAEAAVEFRKMTDHPGLLLADPLGALARLQLARTLALTGQTEAARQTYETLGVLWEHADADFRLAKKARAESAGIDSKPKVPGSGVGTVSTKL